jgi:hypothetical protein
MTTRQSSLTCALIQGIPVAGMMALQRRPRPEDDGQAEERPKSFGMDVAAARSVASLVRPPPSGVSEMNDDIRCLAGFALSERIERAIEHAREVCPPYLFNHVVRSWLFAVRIARSKAVDYDPEVVAIGTLLHDVTLNEHFAGPRRFEVEAADLAREFVRGLGFDDRRVQLIWDSVALNSTPSIGLFKEVEVALCTAGICLDVVGLGYESVPREEIGKIVEAFPRLAMKREMTQCFSHMAQAAPATSYDNFLRDFGERFVPGYKPPSNVDLLLAAPFTD